jgi:hypothetical protein
MSKIIGSRWKTLLQLFYMFVELFQELFIFSVNIHCKYTIYANKQVDNDKFIPKSASRKTSKKSTLDSFSSS